MSKFKVMCLELGVPLAPDKCVGPSQVISYLGIEIDTLVAVTHLPAKKSLIQPRSKKNAEWVVIKNCGNKKGIVILN